mgnify:CR=1 FL=1
MSLETICKTLDVVPGPADGAGLTSIKIRDTGSDTVLKWLNGQRNIKDHMKIKIEAITRGEVKIHDMMPR